MLIPISRDDQIPRESMLLVGANEAERVEHGDVAEEGEGFGSFSTLGERLGGRRRSVQRVAKARRRRKRRG